MSKHWPDVPIAKDVKELANDPDGLIPDCDILTAGYPCQPFSVAGQRRGTEDDRHIWPHILSIVQRKRPSWCVFENVYGHVSMGLDEVLSDLEGESYAARPFIVPACAADAPHRRDRVWIIARNVGNSQHNGSPSTAIQRGSEETSDNDKERQIKASKSERAGQSRNGGSMEGSARANDVGNANGKPKREQSQRFSKEQFDSRAQEQRSKKGYRPTDASKDVAYTDGAGQQQGHKEMARKSSEQSDGGSVQSRDDVAYTERVKRKGGCSRSVLRKREIQTQSGRGSQDAQVRWPVEPSVGRVANGIPRRVDRLRGLGNAIVPQIAMRIGQTIKAVEEQDGW